MPAPPLTRRKIMRQFELVELVRCGPLPEAAARLLEACRRRMREDTGEGPHKPDDLTFILYRQTS